MLLKFKWILHIKPNADIEMFRRWCGIWRLQNHLKNWTFKHFVPWLCTLYRSYAAMTLGCLNSDWAKQICFQDYKSFIIWHLNIYMLCMFKQWRGETNVCDMKHWSSSVVISWLCKMHRSYAGMTWKCLNSDWAKQSFLVQREARFQY